MADKPRLEILPTPDLSEIGRELSKGFSIKSVRGDATSQFHDISGTGLSSPHGEILVSNHHMGINYPKSGDFPGFDQLFITYNTDITSDAESWLSNIGQIQIQIRLDAATMGYDKFLEYDHNNADTALAKTDGQIVPEEFNVSVVSKEGVKREVVDDQEKLSLLQQTATDMKLSSFDDQLTERMKQVAIANPLSFDQLDN